MKNHLIFGLIGVLLIGGTVLPAMSQTQSAESISEIILSLDKPSYDLSRGCTVEDIVNTSLIIPPVRWIKLESGVTLSINKSTFKKQI